MIILGIESSCDETAAALVRDGREILSSVVASQIDVHNQYGGVVPELASRMHLEAIVPVVEQAFGKAGLRVDEIDAVAATRGPGLTGALLVGFTFAKSFAWAKNLDFAGVNHLEAHIHSLFLSDNPPEFPFTALVVSGGHTNIYNVSSEDDFELMGQTRDDAAGEAFDKVAKMLGLGYPGGPVIEKTAIGKDPGLISFPRTMLEPESFDFSFSGLKSSVARYIHTENIRTDSEKAQVAASFQEAVIDVLSAKVIMAAQHRANSMIGVAGGVSANRTFIKKLSEKARKKGIKVFTPPCDLCGDNGAMIAARGYSLIRKGRLCTLEQDVFSREKINTSGF